MRALVTDRYDAHLKDTAQRLLTERLPAAAPELRAKLIAEHVAAMPSKPLLFFDLVHSRISDHLIVTKILVRILITQYQEIILRNICLGSADDLQVVIFIASPWTRFSDNMCRPAR